MDELLFHHSLKIFDSPLQRQHEPIRMGLCNGALGKKKRDQPHHRRNMEGGHANYIESYVAASAKNGHERRYADFYCGGDPKTQCNAQRDTRQQDMENPCGDKDCEQQADRYDVQTEVQPYKDLHYRFLGGLWEQSSHQDCKQDRKTSRPSR